MSRYLVEKFLKEASSYSKNQEVLRSVKRVEDAIELSILELDGMCGEKQSKYLTVMNLCGMLGKIVAESCPKECLEEVCNEIKNVIKDVSLEISNDDTPPK